MGLSIKVKSVLPLDNMMLSVIFENGECKQYDVKQLIKQFPIFKELENRSLFDLVHVDCGGYAIAWNSDIDIPEVELYENGIDENLNGFSYPLYKIA